MRRMRMIGSTKAIGWWLFWAAPVFFSCFEDNSRISTEELKAIRAELEKLNHRLDNIENNTASLSDLSKLVDNLSTGSKPTNLYPTPPSPTAESTKEVQTNVVFSKDDIKLVGENTVRIKQIAFDSIMNNSKLFSEARIVPSFNQGEYEGFKLFAVRPGGFYWRIGIRNGDVVRSINDMPVTSPDKVLEMYQKVKNAKEINVGITRVGKPMTLKFIIE